MMAGKNLMRIGGFLISMAFLIPFGMAYRALMSTVKQMESEGQVSDDSAIAWIELMLATMPFLGVVTILGLGLVVIGHFKSVRTLVQE